MQQPQQQQQPGAEGPRLRPYASLGSANRPRYYDPQFERENDQRTYDHYASPNYKPTNYTPGEQKTTPQLAGSKVTSGPPPHLVQSQVIPHALPIMPAVPLQPISHVVPVLPMMTQQEYEGALQAQQYYLHQRPPPATATFSPNPVQQGGYGAPGYGMPGYGAPGYGAPGYGAPGYGAPGYGAPGYGMPGYGALGQGAPGYGMPGYGAPGPISPNAMQPHLGMSQVLHSMPMMNSFAGLPGPQLANSNLQTEVHVHYEPVETHYTEYQTIKKIIQVPVTEEITEYVPVYHEQLIDPVPLPIYAPPIHAAPIHAAPIHSAPFHAAQAPLAALPAHIHLPATKTNPQPNQPIKQAQPIAYDLNEQSTHQPNQYRNNPYLRNDPSSENQHIRRPNQIFGQPQQQQQPHKRSPNKGITYNARTLQHPLSNQPYTDQFSVRR